MTIQSTTTRREAQVARRIFPKTPSAGPVVSKLSIVDATVGRFSPTAAIWLYDRTEEIQPTRLFETIGDALSQTLDDYPHFAGQIQWATEEMVKNDVVPRHLGRPVITHGTPNDPGVELIMAEHDATLEEVVPSRDDRATRLKEWNASSFTQSEFLPDTKTALMSLNAVEGLPGMAVQLTAFKCGGFGVSAKLAHPLADAVCLMNFMQLWAARSRTLLSKSCATDGDILVKPVFEPARLDRVAGLTPGSAPDPAKVATARALPMHRFDWWAEDAPGFPSAVKPATRATMPPPEELHTTELSPSTFPPWPTWDMSAPCDQVQIRFAADELARLKEAAQESLPDGLKSHHISRQDAILAHIWILMNRARCHPNGQEKVYMNITLGLRNRVNPPLPDNFVGSPLLLGYVEKTVSEALSPQIGPIAGAIRQMMSRFTPDAVAAYIHDAAHEVSPQRLWQGFLGTHHTLVTSWARAKAYELDFCGTQKLARYVQGVMPKIDGLVQVMDVADTGDFDISVCMQREAINRLLKDPLLRQYE
ncbi:Spermidine hydroxycinnamoyl transferase [Colletotrichum chlorophyti]|uniref:Spermidine hydroxycinnamoyl transferase n=1 Tax=Colletotrichum chlorophyti TaxID=708187 RepID=A0A1Q8RT97_9PEZI|nr:Spermidine hydroxycinnamoyl transferase [Colletotrichum chlorophyti]